MDSMQIVEEQIRTQLQKELNKLGEILVIENTQRLKIVMAEIIARCCANLKITVFKKLDEFNQVTIIVQIKL